MTIDKDELKELLKEYLTISVYEQTSGGTDYIGVSVSFDGELICEDEYGLSSR